MNHWLVPGVSPTHTQSLPRGPNLTRAAESVLGTSKRDSVAFSYSHIKKLLDSNQVEALREFLVATVLRLVCSALHKQHVKLSVEERLDLALVAGVLRPGQRMQIQQLLTEADPRRLLTVFLILLRELQPSPLYFEPLVTLCMKDESLFPASADVDFLNRTCLRSL